MADEGTNLSGLSSSALSRVLGERWKLLSDTEKKSWKKTADNLKKEHAKQHPAYKYKPKKRTLSSDSNGVNLPMSPPTSNSSTSPHGSPPEPDANDDSLGSLEDLDLLDVGDIEDNGIQDIIEEVMHETPENEENIPQHIVKNAKVLIPKIAENVLAPQKTQSPVKTVVIPVKPRPGPGRPRKNKANILKPVTTVYKKTKIVTEPKQVDDVADFNLPPIKKVKLSEAEIMTILQQDELSSTVTRLPTINRTDSEMKVEAIEKELLEVDKMFSLEEDNPPSVDNPRQFFELKEIEAGYIGDMDRTFAVFEHKDDEMDDKHIEFMKRLDTWGTAEAKNVNHHLDGFYAENRFIDKTTRDNLGIPEDWDDGEMFDDLDSRVVTESVFLNTWLPKFALKVRKDPYRAMLRSINKRDPEFNIIW